MLRYYDKGNKQFKQFLGSLIGETEYNIPDNLIRHFTDSGMSITDYVKIYHAPFTKPIFQTIEEKERYYRWWCELIVVPPEHIDVWNQYKYIESQPQYEQKSQEWLNQRKNYITASSGAEAIGESKYKTMKSFAIDKAGLGKPFKENANVWHGKKSETIATCIFEEIFNVKIGEFGLIPHLRKDGTHIPFLGASPDGIGTCSTLNGTFSNYVGAMLEIKCVTSRVINDSGPEHCLNYIEKKDPGIVPHYYWIQIQLQLECCDLELCYFWQCKLRDYWSKKLLSDALEKHGRSVHILEQGQRHVINPNLEIGTYVELLPKDTSHIPKDEKIMWYGKYIYPPDMTLSINDKMKWAIDIKRNWKKLYPQYVEDYEFGKIIFYHLEKSHCYLVRRDCQWFKDALPRFKEFWDLVLLYRDDKETRDKLIDEIATEEAKKLAAAEKRKKTFYDVSFEEDCD